MPDEDYDGSDYADDDYNNEYYDEDGINSLALGHLNGMYDEFREYLISRGFDKLDAGSFRVTFKRGNIVIKIPRNADGIIDNRVEATAWRKYHSQPTSCGIIIAPCRLLSNGCLMMVAVDVDAETDNAPDWINRIEGYQVGLYRGKWVAYDYAWDITERKSWEDKWGVRSGWFRDAH